MVADKGKRATMAQKISIAAASETVPVQKHIQKSKTNTTIETS